MHLSRLLHPNLFHKDSFFFFWVTWNVLMASPLAHITLTSDLGGEVGRVTSYKQLQLLIKVAALEVDVPRSNSCRGRKRERERWLEDNIRKDRHQWNWADLKNLRHKHTSSMKVSDVARCVFGKFEVDEPFARCCCSILPPSLPHSIIQAAGKVNEP